jgi:outer membrane protein W
MKSRSFVMVAFIALAFALPARAGGPWEITLLGGLMSNHSASRLEGTVETLKFDDTPSVGLYLNHYWTHSLSTEIGASEGWPRVAVAGAEGNVKGGHIRFTPLSLSAQYHFGSGDGWAPYLGAGVMYLTFRHAEEQMVLPTRTITRIEQPDHLALLLSAGVQHPITSRLHFNADARYGPADSTAEVYLSDDPQHTRQASFHPFVLSAGLTWRF